MGTKQKGHTVGPWRIDGTRIEAPMNRGTVAVTPRVDQGGTFESIQNAQLIVAAPDLLAAARAVEAEHRRGFLDDRTLDAIRMAIAKAEGSS